jgi:hypothetical protein
MIATFPILISPFLMVVYKIWELFTEHENFTSNYFYSQCFIIYLYRYLPIQIIQYIRLKKISSLDAPIDGGTMSSKPLNYLDFLISRLKVGFNFAPMSQGHLVLSHFIILFVMTFGEG